MHTRSSAADFLAADASTKRPLVERLAKSWLLAPVQLSTVDKEQVAMAEVRLSQQHVFFIGYQVPLAKRIGYFLGLC